MASPSSNDDSLTFKMVLCGEKGVGKTAIYHRLKDDKFYDEESHTGLSDECMLSIPCGKHVQVKFNLWDTAGLETFDSCTRSYFNKCHVVIIVYSPDIKGSLATASKCLTSAKENAAGAKLVLVQNKIDLPDSPKRSSELEALRSQFKFEFQTSAKTGQGTKEMMKKLGKYFIKHSNQYCTGSNKKCSKTIRVRRGDSRPWYSKCSCSSS